MKYYVVAKGRKPGIYLTWEACKKQVHGVSGAKFKSFLNYDEAEDFGGDNYGVDIYDTTLEEYQAYLKVLEKNGFKKHVDND